MINRKALKAKNVIFMECDVQEPMRRLAKNFKSVLRSAMMMQDLSQRIGAPLVST